MGNEEVKLSLFLNNMIIYIYIKPKDSTERLLKSLREFGKVEGYKINLRNVVAL